MRTAENVLQMPSVGAPALRTYYLSAAMLQGAMSKTYLTLLKETVITKKVHGAAVNKSWYDGNRSADIH